MDIEVIYSLVCAIWVVGWIRVSAVIRRGVDELKLTGPEEAQEDIRGIGPWHYLLLLLIWPYVMTGRS